MTKSTTPTFAQTFNRQFYPTITPERFALLCDHIDPDCMFDFDDEIDAIIILFSDGSISCIRGEPQGTFH